MMARACSEDDLYNWLNQFEFSKPKKHFARDFSDAVLIAELLKIHFPSLVELHNYQCANSISNKLKNWMTLNDKVLSKIGLRQAGSTLKEAANANQYVIEKILLAVKNKIDELECSTKSQEHESSNSYGGDELYNWVNQFEFSKPKKHFARDFSDAVLIAELLKIHFPRLVELHNYPSANSISNKLMNWMTLNDKVLSKIGLHQGKSTLREAATANRNAIEKILTAVKNKIDELESVTMCHDLERRINNSYDGTRVVDLQIASTVPYEDYNIVLEQLAIREEELQMIQAKNAQMEAMLHVQNERINDLTCQVKRCVCQKPPAL